MNRDFTSSPIKMKLGDTGNVNFQLGKQCCATPSYPALPEKPQINGVTLIGNKIDEELHLQHKMNEITPQEIDKIIYG